MRYDQSRRGNRYDGPYGGRHPAREGYDGHDFYDRSPDWRARPPGRYGYRGGANPIWFGGYGGQGEEDEYMRYYRDPRGRAWRGPGRRPSYKADYGPHYRPNPGHEDAWNYGGYGGFYRQWGPEDTEGRRRSGGHGF
jgi:hypothetical protein